MAHIRQTCHINAMLSAQGAAAMTGRHTPHVTELCWQLIRTSSSWRSEQIGTQSPFYSRSHLLRSGSPPLCTRQLRLVEGQAVARRVSTWVAVEQTSFKRGVSWYSQRQAVRQPGGPNGGGAMPGHQISHSKEVKYSEVPYTALLMMGSEPQARQEGGVTLTRSRCRTQLAWR